MLTTTRFQRGVTLIELLVVVAIVGALASQVVPAFRVWISNVQIRGAAESILNGLQLARSQAVKSNLSTQFVLTTGAPAVGAAPMATGSPVPQANWVVQTFDPAAGNWVFVQGRSYTDGSRTALVSAGQTTIQYTPMGRLSNPPAANINIDVSAAMAGSRPMRVIVSPGGGALMCDPDAVAKSANPNNPQFCP